MKNPKFTKLFYDNIDPIWRYINRKEIHILEAQYEKFKTTATQQNNPPLIIEFFTSFIQKKYKIIDHSNKLFEKFDLQYAKAENQKDKNSILLYFTKNLGQTNARKRIAEKRALKRYLSKDAVTERLQKQVAHLKKQISAAFRCLPAVLKNSGQGSSSEPLSTDFLSFIFFSFQNENISRIRVDILTCLSKIIKDIPERQNSEILTDENISKILKALTDTKFETWEKCEILNILALIQHNSFPKQIGTMLHAEKNSDIFLRRHALSLLLSNISLFTNVEKLLEGILSDPSAFVRQKLAESLHLLENKTLIDKFYSHFLLKETDIAVRCSALKTTPLLLASEHSIEQIILPYKELLKSDSNPKLIEFALLTIPDCFEAIKDSPKNRETWLKEFFPAIEHLHCNAETITIRRKAAEARELLWCNSHQQAKELLNLIKNKTNSLKPGKSVKLSKKEIENFDDITIGRVLGVISQHDCAIELHKTHFTTKLIKNHKLGFRWWRFLHEFRNPSPDKRQTFSHTRGKHFRGQIRSSSSIMAELSETKVPGEPLFISTEGSSRPYLPMLDEFISASETPETIRVFSPEGISTITPPKKFLKRFITDFKMAFKFKKYASLRNWQEDSQCPPSEYIAAIKKLGFGITITPYPKDKFSSPKIDPKVKRFFSINFLIPLYLSGLFNDLKVYFLSLYQNTIPQLSLFVVALLALFFGRHLTLNALIRKSRSAIPLVIGGWGTRGKSGTERIKAALFASLGCSVISKTTGCEAMFLYTPPFDRTREMFLFRPYDKATIWEQYNIFRLADKLDADVFLWECMALSPSYVRILQKHWMKDDFSTITNTYPDHEDIQGPAGWNIAETMTNFVPTKGNLVTAEEQLFPYLEVDAKHKNTKFSRVNWMDAILIPSDILERFPYEEHPHNIALVLKVVEQLGISREYALKEMADNVVPDIGVLKKYPVAKVKSRELEFLSGMSANERFGCMQNWTRMGLDQISPEEKPDVWITTVVNNRADRIARSRAFAKILVEDISVDKHFLIGNNLKGMLGYIKEAWDANLADFTLWDKNHDKKHALEQFDTKADFLRIPKIGYRLQASGNGDKETDKYYETYQTLSEEYKAFKEKIAKCNSNYKTLDNACKELLWKWFEQKLVVIENYSATGNEIVEIIAQTTPPGIHNKIMALQNIKGTGLDFFYRWQAWENCFNICEKIKDASPEQLEPALRELSKIKNFEILSIDTISETLTEVEKLKNISGTIKSLLKELKEKLDASSSTETTASEKTDKSSDNNLFLKLLENFIDPGDSIRRRKRTNRIYKDLAKGRISYNQAIVELQTITKKQKGGWLKLKK